MTDVAFSEAVAKSIMHVILCSDMILFPFWSMTAKVVWPH